MDAKQGLLDLVVSTGWQVFEAMLEQDREALCGPKKRVPERRATRAGRTRGEVTLGADVDPLALAELLVAGWMLISLNWLARWWKSRGNLVERLRAAMQTIFQGAER